jgi:hypothetical protein
MRTNPAPFAVVIRSRYIPVMRFNGRPALEAAARERQRRIAEILAGMEEALVAALPRAVLVAV